MPLIHGVDAVDALHPLLVDSSGRVIVTAASLPLPSGAATEATLTDIETLVQSLVNALVSVATDRLRADIISALPAGTNNIGDVDVLSSALPSGASTLAEQQTQTAALAAIQTAIEILDNIVAGSEAQVDIVSAPTLQVQNQNGDMLEALESIVVDNQSDLNATAGYNELESAAVPTGKVWKITTCTVYDENTVNTFLLIYATNGTLATTVLRVVPTVAFQAAVFTGELWLPAGWWLVGGYGACTLNDNIRLQIGGIQMDAP